MRRYAWKGATVFAAAAVAAGCAGLPGPAREAYVEASAVVEEDPAPPAARPVPDRAALLGGEDPAVAAALRRFQATGQAPVVREPGFVRFPYGEREPVLTCQPLRVCDVELEAGETVLSIAVGDAERWIASKVESGPAEARRAHVVVKPTDFDLATNLVVTTDRRAYHLALVSSAESEGGDFLRSIGFYYPAEMVQRFAAEAAGAREAAREAREREVARLPQVDPERLHFGYEIRGDRVPWRPVQAFDDGTRVFLQMPDAMRVTEAPALFVLADGKDQALVNYRVRGRFYVVDQLFEKAVLVLGVGGREKSVTVTRVPGRGARR